MSFNHTQLRFKERFNKELTGEEYSKLRDLAINNALVMRKNENKPGYKCLIEYDNGYIWVVLSSKMKQIKTVYPLKIKNN